MKETNDRLRADGMYVIDGNVLNRAGAKQYLKRAGFSYEEALKYLLLLAKATQ